MRKNANSAKSENLALKVREAADAYRVCPATIRNLIRRGELDAMRFGRSIRIPRRTLAKLLGE